MTRRYGATLAVNHVDLTLNRGEVHAVVGENGAGKSTAAKMAAGVVSPTAGTIELDEQVVRFRSAHDAEAAGIVMIPQELQLYEPLSITENLFVGRPRPRRAAGFVDTAEMSLRSREVLDRLGIGLAGSLRVEQLSPATRQLVAIARALILEARILIMDEPTAALDEWETQRLLATVSSLRESGVGVLYVSHRLHEVKQVSDRITVMRDGAVVAHGGTGTFTEPELVRAMVGRSVSMLARKTVRARGKTALKVEGLSRDGEFADVGLELRAGEVVGMAGLIGSGRSEFAQAVIGHTKPASGSIEVEGARLRRRGVRNALRAGMGYVPEERISQGLFLPLTVRENITLPSIDRLTHGGFIARRSEERYAVEAVRPLNVRGEQTDRVASLSGGNQQKVLLGRWIGLAPRVLLLDEPTRGIDVGARAEIYQLIDRLTEKGVAILLISSDIQELILLSDRVLVMRNGSIVAEFAGDGITEVNVGAAALGAAEHFVEGASS